MTKCYKHTREQKLDNDDVFPSFFQRHLNALLPASVVLNLFLVMQHLDKIFLRSSPSLQAWEQWSECAYSNCTFRLKFHYKDS